jgi:type II secretory ATPase GspE/PulE/Tfp pilus assembly ATPase PilB-like protein
MDMGIEPFLINAALIGVLAQQLARKICVACRYEAIPTIHERNLMDRLNIHEERLFKGRGCDICFNLGYKGRVGLFELLVMSNELRALIVKQPLFDALHKQALDDGMQTLSMDGAHKVKEGIISLQELARIVL